MLLAYNSISITIFVFDLIPQKPFMNKLLLLSFAICFSVPLIAQNPDTVATKPEKNCEQQAVGDLFKKKDKAPKPPKKLSALVLPNISSNPTNGFIFGVGGAFGWFMGPKETTKVSSAAFTAAVTSKKQLITFAKPNIGLAPYKSDFLIEG
jgi:hypothetical protein